MIFALPLLGAIGSGLASAATGEAGKTQKAAARGGLSRSEEAAPADFSAALLGLAGSSTPSAPKSETPATPHVRTVVPFAQF
jgi:hypothetical protein